MSFEIYEPLVKRYRPKILEDLIGQDEVVAQIQGMILSKRISRTYLIHGPWGSGKTTVARLLARYLNCANPDVATGTPCGTCKQCEKMDKGIHPDVIEINAADARGIDDIRQIMNTAIYKPQSNYRIYILDEIHQLTPQAMSSFLKMLEEPPATTVFCLCTTNPEKLLDTIVSRCQQICIGPVSIPACTYLLYRVAYAEGCMELANNEMILEKIAKLTRSHPRDALQALEVVINHLKSPNNRALPTDETLGKVLTGIIEKVIGLPPWELAIKYLTSLYVGKYALTFKLLKTVVDYDYFLRLVLELHTQTLYRSINQKLLCDFQYNNYLEGLASFDLLIDRGVASRCIPKMVSAIGQVKTYLVDSKSIALALNAELLEVMENAIATGKISYDNVKFNAVIKDLGVIN